MFKNKNYDIITGLDIGTETIKILVVLKKPEQEGLEVLSQIIKPCSGVRKGVVIKPENITEAIKALISEAENSSGEKIKSVYSNINGSHLSAVFSRGKIAVSRADKKISQEDIDRAVQASKEAIILPPNKEVIGFFPKEYIIDGESGIKEALGMEGLRLEAEVLLLSVFSPYLQNLTKAISNAELKILDIQPSPIAAAEAVLTPQQKELGVALIDIGAETTGIAIFEEENLIHTAIFPIGSSHITRDIAIGLKCDVDLAEKIKLEFGSCALGREKGEKYKRDKIKIGDSLSFSRKMLNGVIEARVSEIFEQIDKELKNISRQKLLPAGLVLTGGGAKLPKIVDFAKKELKLPCRLGKPKGFIGLEGDPSLSTVCGLVLGGIGFEGEIYRLESGKGIISSLKDFFRYFKP